MRVSSGSLPIQKTKRVPKIARACLAALGAQLRMLKGQILEFDRMINAWHRPNKARSSTRFQALAPRSLPLWSLAAMLWVKARICTWYARTGPAIFLN